MIRPVIFIFFLAVIFSLSSATLAMNSNCPRSGDNILNLPESFIVINNLMNENLTFINTVNGKQLFLVAKRFQYFPSWTFSKSYLSDTTTGSYIVKNSKGVQIAHGTINLLNGKWEADFSPDNGNSLVTDDYSIRAGLDTACMYNEASEKVLFDGTHIWISFNYAKGTNCTKDHETQLMPDGSFSFVNQTNDDLILVNFETGQEHLIPANKSIGKTSIDFSNQFLSGNATGYFIVKKKNGARVAHGIFNLLNGQGEGGFRPGNGNMINADDDSLNVRATSMCIFEGSASGPYLGAIISFFISPKR